MRFRALARLLVLYLQSRYRNRHYFTKIHLSPWYETSIHTLMESKDDNGYFHHMGLDVLSFEHLFELIRGQFRPYRANGRPDCLPPRYQLSLFLKFLKSECVYKDLSFMYGISESSVGVVIRKLMRKVLNALKEDHFARILWPNEDEIRHFQQLIKKRHPRLDDGVFAFVDGAKIECNKNSNPLIQNSTFVSNMLVWAPDGTVCFAVLNFRGSYHDARVADALYTCLDDYTPEGALILGDAAYMHQNPKIITPFKKDTFSRDPEEKKQQKEIHKERVSARQTVEWGMAHLKKSFPRLHQPLRATDWEYNQNLILLCVHLNNFQVRKMKLFNQIYSVFNK